MTVAIYQQTPHGSLKIGTFRPRQHYSVRAISQQFMRKYPNLDPSTLSLARRWRVMGRWADGERIPFEVEKKESFMKLGWGLANAVPDTASAAFGARWIFPCDQLPDRVATFGFETPEGQLLKDWLNGKPSGTGAIHKARNRARQLKLEGKIRPDSNLQVTLFEDGTGIFVGNPSSSYGYLHVAAWIKPAAVVAAGEEQ